MLALYRTRQYADAISYLDRSLAAGNGEADALDLFFLAMAHHQLGHHRQSRGYYRPSRPLVQAQKGLSDSQTNELASVRSEAEATLAHFADDLPDQVFANPGSKTGSWSGTTLPSASTWNPTWRL